MLDQGWWVTVVDYRAALLNIAHFGEADQMLNLAAGDSSRFETPKQLLNWQGKTLLEHAIQNIEPLFKSRIIVVLGSNAEAISAVELNHVKIIKNSDWQEGIAMSFDYSFDFKNIDFRQHPECYRIGKGEQGVLLVEPYKSEILPFWRFKTPQLARQSADKIYQLFLDYKRKEEFVGMDMARKFLQMGYTRARRYANHKSGLKYAEEGEEVLPLEEDATKAKSAKIFYEKWQKAKADQKYQELKVRHQEWFEGRRRNSGFKAKDT